jgi:phenylacetate-coenzyme A ligase PaaK-like adenylate-forming protein
VLRFDIGDAVRLDDRGPCPCGRGQGMVLRAVEGRVSDVTFDREGNAVSVDDLDALLAGVPGLAGWQLELPRPGRLHLRMLAAPGGPRPAGAQARERLRGLYGDRARVETAVEKALLHEPSGKIRFVRAAYPSDHTVLWRSKR